MMKKLLIFLALIVVFVFLKFLHDDPYFNWFFSSKYFISSVKVEQAIQKDGTVKVHEIITYTMRKPFRGVYRYIPPERYVEIGDVNIWTEGVKTQYVDLHKTKNSFEAKVWLVPFQSTQQLDPKEHKNITLHVLYTARYVLENGMDVSQLFRQFWGPDWDSPAKNIEAIFSFPENLNPVNIYTHPKAEVEKSRNNTYTIKLKRLPPYSFGEVRFVFDVKPNMKYTVKNPGLKFEDIKKEERKYERDHLKRTLIPVIIYIIFVSGVILIYVFMGREPEIDYQAIYEREIPYKDSPDLVNSVVKNLTGKVDQDGIVAVIMDLYKKDYIDFVDTDKKDRVIIIKSRTPREDLSESEKDLLRILVGFSSADGKFDFESLKKEFKKSVSKAKRFTKRLQNYEQKVSKEVNKRSYLLKAGNTLAKALAISLMVLAFVLRDYVPRFPHNNLYDLCWIMSIFYWITGSIVLVTPRDVFGRWTKAGREYYLKWKNFEKFLLDFSLLSEHPPESVILWEDYLVYATALGIADKVEKNLRKLIPRKVWNENSAHPMLYTASSLYVSNSFASLRSVASSVTSNSNSSSGGFSGGTGGAGSGSGGGGGGAF